MAHRSGMTQRLWPQPHHPRHLLFSVSPPMGEQTLSHTHHSPPPLSAPDSSATVTTPTTASPSSSLPNPDSSTSFFSPPPAVSPTSAVATTAAKIPRPRKVRKASSDGDAAQPNAKRPPSNQVAIRVLPRPLTAGGEITAALRHLSAADPVLARVIDAHEPPAFKCLHPPFHSLTRSILYQQLAFKAAASIYSRFLSLCGGEAGVVPEVVLALAPHQLRQIGVSGRKAGYLHDLAHKYHAGILSDAAIVAMDDKSLFSMLTMVKGIGAWSVHMFMIFSLHRPDVLPVVDVGVRKGVQILYGLDELPRPSQMEQLCQHWRPYRSVGSWYMWRLVEANGLPAIRSMGAETLAISDGLGGGGAASHLQQHLLIDPILMLPNFG